jgi:hypothetical protein
MVQRYAGATTPQTARNGRMAAMVGVSFRVFMVCSLDEVGSSVSPTLPALAR